MTKTPREVAEDVDGSDGLARVLAAAIDAADHKRGLYDMRRPVADLGNDQIDELMEELVLRGFAKWIREPKTLPSGRCDFGLIRPTAAGRRLLQTAINEEHEAKSVRGRIKRYGGAVVRGVRHTAGFVTDLRAIGVVVLAVLALAFSRGCWS